MVTIARTQESPTALADNRWQAVVDRDRGRDGEFVFAVSTTGIYCRPSCPATAASRECQLFVDLLLPPSGPGFAPAVVAGRKSGLSPQEELVARATTWLDAHIEEQ